MTRMQQLSALGVVLGVLGVATGLLGPAIVPAGANIARPGGVMHAGRGSPFIPGTTLPGAALGNTLFNRVTARNWSGYAVQGAAPFTNVSGTWTQPDLTCGSKVTSSAFWVGLDGYADQTVEQLGTQAWCTGGQSYYSAWYEMYPAYPRTFSGTVLPGDVMTAKVVRTGTTYKLTMTDVTQGWSHTVTKRSSAAKNTSAEWIVEAPCCLKTGAPLPLSSFGTVDFTGAMAATGAGMEPISTFKSDDAPHEIVMTKNRKPIAQPSVLTPSGTSFSVTRET
jgi:Peptidase A4 family